MQTAMKPAAHSDGRVRALSSVFLVEGPADDDPLPCRRIND